MIDSIDLIVIKRQNVVKLQIQSVVFRFWKIEQCTLALKLISLLSSENKKILMIPSNF